MVLFDLHFYFKKFVFTPLAVAIEPPNPETALSTRRCCPNSSIPRKKKN